MLPGLIAGHYDYSSCHIDLEALCRFARVRFVRDVVVGIDPVAHRLDCASSARLSYDLVSLDIGSAHTRDILHPSSTGGVPVKPTEHFLERWAAAVERAEQQRLCIVMVGAGAAGVEVTLAMQHHLSATNACPARFSIVSASAEILPGHSAGVRKRFERILHARNVDIHLESKVAAVGEREVRLESQRVLEADWVVWSLGPRASEWIARSGLQTDDAGFVLVDRHLRSVSHPAVFAAGDIASMRDHPRPKSGVYAVRQGPPLAANLRAVLVDQPLQPYHPQRRALALISTGDRYAIASWGELSLEGAWVWRWKDHIDRRFMARYRVE